MRSRWAVHLGVGLVVVGAALWFARPTLSERVPEASESDLTQPASATNAAPANKASAPDDSLPGAPPRRTDAEPAAPVELAHRQASSFNDDGEPALVRKLWDLDEESAYLFDHSIGDHRPERHGVRLDPQQLLALRVGDSFAMPLPGIGEVEGTVVWVNEAENGDRGVGAVIDSDNDAYTATLTFGDRALFGQISTPDGRFFLEGMGGSAAIFRDDLDLALIDTSLTDERIPPEELQ